MADKQSFSAFMFFTPTGDLKGESRAGMGSGAGGGTVTAANQELAGKFPFELTKVDIKALNPTNIGSAGKDKQGKVKFDPFEFTKPTDRATVGFFKSCANGKEYDSAEIHVHRNGNVFMKVVLYTCVVSEVHLQQEGDEESFDTIQIDYGAVKFTYYEQMKSGAMKAAIEASWDRTKNAPKD